MRPSEDPPAFARPFPYLTLFLSLGCSSTLLINIILTLVGWVPGVIHAIYVSVVNVAPVPAVSGPRAGAGPAMGTRAVV